MARVGVFADVSNLYYCTNLKFGSKIDYAAYMEFIKGYGDITRAIAYGAQMKDEAQSFITVLEHCGFQVKYKTPKEFRVSNGQEIKKRKADWDVGIAMDIVELCLGAGVDTIFLGSADGDLKPAVEWAVRRGHKVVIFACGISRELKEVATTWIEIPESCLNAKKDDPEA